MSERILTPAEEAAFAVADLEGRAEKHIREELQSLQSHALAEGNEKLADEFAAELVRRRDVDAESKGRRRPDSDLSPAELARRRAAEKDLSPAELARRREMETEPRDPNAGPHLHPTPTPTHPHVKRT